MRSNRTHSICTSAKKKDVYIRPFTVSRATKIFSCQQPKTYIHVLHVLRQQPTTYIYVLIKWLFIDVWLLDVLSLWLLSYIYKALDIIEIMSNCNINSQGRIYSSILQGFSKTMVAEVYIEIYMLQTKEFAYARQVKTVEDCCWWNSDRTYIYAVGCLDACTVVAHRVQRGRKYTSLACKGLEVKLVRSWKFR